MSQGPGLPSRLSSTEQMVVSARVASRRTVAAARGVWDYLSSLPLSGAVCSGDLSGRLSSAHEAKCPRLLIHSCL